MKSSIFIKTFGDSPKVRIWDFLLDNVGLDFSKSEIARQIKISRATLDRIWPYLTKNKLLVENRRIGRAVLFRVNKENKIMKMMLELDNFLMIKKFDKLANVIEIPA